MTSIFAQETSTLEAQVAALQAQIAAAQQRISKLAEAESVADSAIQALQGAVERVSSLAPSAIANLKSAVLNLFQGGGNNDGGNGNQPINPPQPSGDGGCEIDSQPNQENFNDELTARIAETSMDAIATQPEPLNPMVEVVEAIADATQESGEVGEVVDAIAVVEPQPEVTPDAPNESTYFELIPVSDAVAYFRNNKTGEIVTTYVGFNNKTKAEKWGKFLTVDYSLACGFELRDAKRLSSFKYEIKLWDLSIHQIQNLAESDLQKAPHNSYGNTYSCKPNPVVNTPTTDWKGRAKELEISINKAAPGLYVTYHGYRKLGQVVEKFDADNNSWWENRNQISMLSQGNGDGQKYSDSHEAAIGLAKFLKLIVEPEVAKDSLFGGGYDEPVAQQQIESGDWVELLVNGERYQVAEVDGEGIHLVTDDGNMLVQSDEVKLQFKLPANWQPF